ncbi:MAG: hypothetical protein U0325_19755 [Polyangiales bacterium]
MTLTHAHTYLPSNAWQARNVARAIRGAAGVEVVREGGHGMPQTSAPTLFGCLDSRARLQGCNTKRGEDPAGWQEQRLL